MFFLRRRDDPVLALKRRYAARARYGQDASQGIMGTLSRHLPQFLGMSSYVSPHGTDAFRGGAAHREVMAGVLDHLCGLLDEWNQTHSKCGLPTEILATCFAFMAFDDLVAASQVSRAWRRAAVAFPTLWPDVNVSAGKFSGTLLRLAIMRAESHPVTLSISGGLQADEDRAAGRMLASSARYLGSVTYLSVPLGTLDAFSYEYLPCDVPCFRALRELDVHWLYEDEDAVFFYVISIRRLHHTYPSLEVLRIHVTFRPDSPLPVEYYYIMRRALASMLHAYLRFIAPTLEIRVEGWSDMISRLRDLDTV